MFARSFSSSINRCTYAFERSEFAASPAFRADSCARLLLTAIKPLLTLSDPGRAYTRITPDQPVAPILVRRVQGMLEHVAQLVDVQVLELFALVLGDLLHVALVSLRQDHPLDPRPLRGEGLLLHTSDREHLPRERDLA